MEKQLLLEQILFIRQVINSGSLFWIFIFNEYYCGSNFDRILRLQLQLQATSPLHQIS